MLPEERKLADRIIQVLNTGKKFDWLQYHDEIKNDSTAFQNAVFRLEKNKIIRRDNFDYLQGENFEYGKTYDEMIDPKRSDKTLPLYKKNWFENLKAIIGITGVCCAIFFGVMQIKNNRTINQLENTIDTLKIEKQEINSRFIQYKDQYEQLRKQRQNTLKR